jgi:hypothetical protein
MIECFDLRIGERARIPLALMVRAEYYRALAVKWVHPQGPLLYQTDVLNLRALPVV